MDVSVQKREKKREKKRKREAAKKLKNRKDWINQLPDDILCKILYLLPTKMAVASEILSRRWKNIWIGVPAISLNYYDGNENFVSIINRLLFNHLDRPIHRFNLDFKPTLPVTDLQLESWISSVITRGLEELNLSFSFTPVPAVRLPMCLFSCSTLVSLTLCDNAIMDVPTSVSFPILKTLQLERLIYANGGCLKLLISKCLILETLIIARTLDDGIIDSLDIKVPWLKTLAVKRVSTVIDTYKLYVDAPLLERIELSDENIWDFQLQDLSNLREAIIDITVVSHSDDDNAIGRFANIEFLSLSEVALVSYDAMFPMFSKLVWLEITTSCGHWIGLVNLFRQAKELKTLIYHPLSRSDHTFYGQCIECFLKTPLKCIKKSLTTVKVTGFVGDACSKSLIQHILRQAKKVEIWTSSQFKKYSRHLLRDLLESSKK